MFTQLHPIFEEDELTLIIAGGFLGFAAGLVQQGIETGAAAKWVSKCKLKMKMFASKLFPSLTTTDQS